MQILLIIFVNLFISCTNKTSVQENFTDRQWEGWAGPPHNPNLKPHDYFYITLSGEVKSKKVKPEDMEKACIDSVRGANPEQTKVKIIQGMVASINDGPYLTDSEIRAIAKSKTMKQSKIEIKTCVNNSLDLQWRECKCVVYTLIQGGREYIFY